MIKKRSKQTKSTIVSVSLLLLCLVFTACSVIGNGGDVTTEAESSGETTLPYGAQTGNDTTRAPEDSSSPDTHLEDTAGATPDETSGIPETNEETKAPEPEVQYVDPLTGLKTAEDLGHVLPIAITLDNLSAAAPQSGISRADILMEVLVEGGITRLIMITNDYGGSEVYGPVRSVRHYTVSLGQAFGSLTVGAGGSPLGYTMVKSLGIPFFDGVNDTYSGLGFYRDKNRMAAAGAAHSLMTTGERLQKLASRRSWSMTSESEVRPVFNFADDEFVFTGEGEAAHVCIPYSSSQYVQLIYSRTANTYYRYQLGDRAHIDAVNGEQLNFTNVFILFADTEAIPGDTEGRLDVTVTGEGSGYYISGGRYQTIKWSRIGDTSPFIFTDTAGNVITVERGKTFISVAQKAIENQVDLNYHAW